MKLTELLRELNQRDIRLYIEEGRLRCKSPQNALNADLRTAIETHRDEIRELLAPKSREVLKIERAPRNGPLPLSFAQQRLWFLDQLDPNSTVYNIPVALRLTGALDIAALKGSFEELVRRHEILRTTYRVENDLPVQQIAAGATTPLPIQDLSELEEEACEEAVHRIALEEAQRPFDLETGPMLRIRLLVVSTRTASPEHVLVIVFHHIVTDDWSSAVFFKDLAAVYSAFAARRPSPLQPLALQYADFAVAQRKWLQGELLDEHLRYWQAKLADNVPCLDLPTRQTPLGASRNPGAELHFDIPRALRDRLRRLGQSAGVTQFVLLLAAFYALLYRYTGQQDISIGTPIANRNVLDTEQIMGFFVNTLVLRADLSGDPLFPDFLAQTQTLALEAQAYQDLPFERLVEALRSQVKDAGQTPLFQLMFVFHNIGFEDPAIPGFDVRILSGIKRNAVFDLVLHIAENDKELRGWFEYNTDLFEAETAARLVRHYRNLLEGIVAEPARRLSELPMLDESERRRSIVEWNDTSTDYPSDKCVHQLFEEQAAAAPEATALIFAGARLTYAELDHRANRLARRLRDEGVGPEIIVGICMERSLEMVIGLLAILKAGGAYLPLDPDYPKERIAYMIADAAPRLVLTQDRLAGRLPAQTSLLRLDADWPSLAGHSADPLPPRATPQNLAYVIYTSGSTGNPKGVGVPHRGLVNRIDWMQKRYGLTADDVVLQKTPFSFDVSVWEFFWPLQAGARLALAPANDHRDPVRLAEIIRQCAVTTLHFVPTMLQAFSSVVDMSTLPSLRRVICSGEELPVAAVEKFHAAARCELHNLYGPTEASIDVSAYRCTAGDNGERTPIGRPISNIQLYVLDRNLEPVPVGVAGELHIGGIGLARGYLQRPDLTADRFAPDPFGKTGGRLYRTGDLARVREDGEIEFLGRVDHQVKIRGFRIELGEIETALLRHPSVQDAVVITRESEREEKQLVAYLVEADRGGSTARNWRTWLRDILPDYMVPSAFVVMDSLPLTANGKVDRKALPAPDFSGLSTHSHAPPRTQTEELLSALWAEVLGVARVGVRDDFFELGGHSLLATQVISRIRRTFDIDLPLRSLFERTTIAALAPLVEEARSGDESRIAPPLEAAPRTGVVPLSFAQQRLWFLDQLEPGASFYCVPAALRLRGDLNVAAIEAGLRGLTQRHEILRTTFPARDGQPRQEIAPKLDAPLRRVDLRGLEPERREAEMRRLVEEEARRPFDLARGPLARATLIELGDKDYVLAFMLHHIVSDGWSIDILIRDFAALYTAFSRDRSPDLPQLPVQYADFSRWQRSWLQGEALETQMSYWRRQLQGAPPALELPTDHPRPAIQSYRGATLNFEVPEAVTERLRALGRAAGATLFMVLLAAFKVLLMRYSGQRDLCVGTPIANRTRLETEGLIGFFVNTLVLRTDLSGDPTFDALLARVRETALDAQAYQDLPFEKLVEELQPTRDPSRSPLFQAMFVLQNAPLRALDLPGLRVESVEPDTQTAKFDLMLTLMERDNALQGEWEYNTDLFEAETAARLVRHYRNLLESIVAKPARRLSELPMLDESERRRSIVEWNDTSTDYPSDKCVHQLFEEQAAAAPEATALIFAGARLTYAELDHRANRLAGRLRDEGVGPEIIVGICVERSLEMVIGLLAILKAGGAYLPLDPDYPKERIAYMIADAAPRLVLTQDRLAGRLPAQTSLLRLDADWPSLAGHSADPLPPRATPQNLAYVIYTSGSTGNPKGVGVPHRGLVNRIDWMQKRYGLTADDVVLQKTPFSFDVSVWEFFWPLQAGARLALAPANDHRDPVRLAEIIRQCAVTTLHFVPTMLQAFSSVVDMSTLPSLRRVICSGEELPVAAVEKFHAAARCELHNLYGPTEASIDVSAYRCTAGDNGDRTPIGRPISNIQLYVLDRNLEPVPIGVAGELHIGGIGLARGYLQRPDLTADRFAPDPFGKTGGRLYRTGDLARVREDGEIEFLGRVDHQVKIRGFRIELGEIETVLLRHPSVQDAVVITRESEDTQKRLIAYITAAADGERDEITRRAFNQTAKEAIGDWRAIFDDTWSKDEFADKGDFNTSGWVSSFTGQPISAPDMLEWLDAIVARISDQRPRNVLEIGCGVGLLLFRIAPISSRYVGTDISAAGLAYIERELGGRREKLSNIETRLQSADDFSGFNGRKFDTVIINSVVQYFPDADYLVKVVKGALEVMEPDGRIIIGDVRNLVLLKAFHAAVESFKAAPGTSCGELKQRVQRRIAEEDELLLHPKFFLELPQVFPQIRTVDVLAKRGRCRSEMTMFRYDVILHLGDGASASEEPPEIKDWSDIRGLAELQKHLTTETASRLIVRNVPNARCGDAVQLLLDLMHSQDGSSIGELLSNRSPSEEAVDPEDIWVLGSDGPYEVKADWSRGMQDGSFDVVCQRRGKTIGRSNFSSTDATGGGNWKSFANIPLRGRVARGLGPELRTWLRDILPDYMVPSAFVVMDSLPLTANGKVDRKALPAPDFGGLSTHSHAPPRTQTEELLSALWAEVLGVARVGVRDDFFELGGHSLLATQVISRIRRTFDIDLPLRSLFERTTIAALAPLVEEARSGDESRIAPPLEAAPRTGVVPLSFAQQRLWFLDQLEPGASFYCVPAALRLRGDLNVAAIEAGLRGLTQRHEILRTTFPARDGQPRQEIAPKLDAPLRRVDLRGLEPERREAEMRRLVEEEARRPFDLARGPLARATLIELGDKDYVLAFMLHHIVSDGWSIDILIRDFAALYTAFSRDRSPNLPQLPVQYADFSRWQRSWLQGEALETQMSYWRRQLQGAPPALELPTDHPRPAIQSYRGATLNFEVPEAVTERLRALGRAAGATLFMVLLAAFKVLLMRYSGQRDLCVGTPIANRTRLETEGLIGFFVNTLVLRTDLSGDPTFDALLARVRETALDAQAYQDLPFEKLVEELQPTRDPSRSPLFQAMFVLQNAPLRALDLPGLRVESVEPDTQTAKFDLMLTLMERDNALQGEWEYNTDLFEAETAARLVRHYRNLLESIVAKPARRLSELPMLDESERRRSIVEWNDTSADYPSDKCVHQLFEEQAAAAPEATALIFAGARLTYAELDHRANRLAGRLRDEGVGPEIIVGICMERSLEMVIGLLAILKAGGAYLPLDPDYPKERIAYMIADAAPRLVLTQDRLAGRLPAQTSLLRLDADWPSLAGHSADPLPLRATPQNLAYVIYTSGSTGNPKGVGVPHKGVVRLLKNANYVRFDNRNETVLQFAPLAFDASTFEIWGPILNGAALLLAPSATSFALDDLGRLVEDHAVTTLWLTAALFQRVVDRGLENFVHVRQLLTGGDVVSPSHAREFREACPSSVLINGYGPTENTTFSTFHVISEPKDDAALPIGRPVSNSRAYVLDAALDVVPIGVVGELYLEGAGLARGYFKRPDLTAERFIPSPLAPDSGERMYRTGDLARYRSDGTIEFLGRIDKQVKIRGFRIEIGEIEAALARLPHIRQAVVIAREDRSGEKSLAAYFVGQPGELVEAETVREALEQELPAYMIPGFFRSLDVLPLTDNGKVDRDALHALDIREPDEARFVAPRTRIEEILSDLFAQLLQTDRIGIRDNFFHFGGHSLLAYSLAHRIRETLRCKLSLLTIFQYPTVEQLARFIEQNRDDLHRTLVELRAGTSGATLHCIHPAGSVSCYVPLAQNLGGRFPIYGLDSRAVIDPGYKPRSIIAIAEEYADRIHREKNGPYYLLGWSMGGLIAHAMAAALENRGEEVAFLGLLDTRLRAVVEDSERLDLFAEYLGRNPADQAAFARMDAEERRLLIQANAHLPPDEWFIAVAKHGQAQGTWLCDIPLSLLKSLFTEWWDGITLTNAYDPPRIRANMRVWWAKETIDRFGGPPVDWSLHTCGDVAVSYTEGNHETIVEDIDVFRSIALCLNAAAKEFPELTSDSGENS